MDFTIAELQKKLFKYAERASAAHKSLIHTGETLLVLEDMKPTRFAQITEKQEGKTTAEKERKARVSKEWMHFLRTMHFAREACNNDKWEYKTCDRYWETSRTSISTKKTELNQLGG